MGIGHEYMVIIFKDFPTPITPFFGRPALVKTPGEPSHRGCDVAC